MSERADLSERSGTAPQWVGVLIKGLRVLVGGVATIWGAAWAGLAGFAMPYVGYFGPPDGSRKLTPHTFVDSWDSIPHRAAILALIGVGLMLLTGLGRHRVDVGQVLGSLWTALWLILTNRFMESLFFVSRDDCTYASCWPFSVQGLLKVSPVLLGTAVCLFVGLLGRPRLVLIRGLIPLLVMVVGAVVQESIWMPYVFPVLAGPPLLG